MKNCKKDVRVNNSLFSFRNYLIFFLLVSFIVTCCFLLFFRTIEIKPDDIRKSAIATFGNVLFLSFLCCLVDGIRRKLTIAKPLKRILQATQKISKGDFNTRIQPLHRFERKDEFDVIIEDFNRMAQELSGMETLQTDFVANVSHELKTPLAIIQNYAVMLQNPSLSKDTLAEYTVTIIDTTRRLSDLITNILKLNKLENQQVSPEQYSYNLSEQLCESLLSFESLWDEKGINIETDIKEDVIIFSDRELLSLVWNNLFSNALKFTDRGGTITLSLTQEQEVTIVNISDTGCGISKEIGAHIFDKFYQGDKSHSTLGNGLGLALVKRVIELVGGEISVDSTLGKGSTFTVRLWRNHI